MFQRKLGFGEGQNGFEIKSARTITPSFFDGLNACEQALGPLRFRAIVYRGGEGRVEKGTQVVPWHQFQVGR